MICIFYVKIKILKVFRPCVKSAQTRAVCLRVNKTFYRLFNFRHRKSQIILGTRGLTNIFEIKKDNIRFFIVFLLHNNPFPQIKNICISKTSNPVSMHRNHQNDTSPRGNKLDLWSGCHGSNFTIFTLTQIPRVYS